MYVEKVRELLRVVTVSTVFPGIGLRNTIISPTFFSVNTIWRAILFEGQHYLKFRRLLNIVNII